MGKAKPLPETARPRPSRNNAKKRPRPSLTRIMDKNRFDGKSSEELTPAEIEFGKAMADYLGRWSKAEWMCGEVLDVLATLGYVNQERNFEVCVRKFTNAIRAVKLRKHAFPTWSEVLKAAALQGWRLPGKRPGRDV